MRKFTSSFVAAALAATFAVSSIVPVNAAPVVAPTSTTASNDVIKVQRGVLAEDWTRLERRFNRAGRRDFRDARREFRRDRREFRQARRAFRRGDISRSDFRQARREFRRDRRDFRRGFYMDRGYGWYNGYRGYRYHRHGYRHYNGWWFPLGAFAAGAIVAGAINADRPYYRERVYYRGGNWSAHVEWCYNRYRSYREWDNTFQPYHGPRRQCYSPYS